MRRALLSILAFAVVLAACGTSEIKPDGAAKSVVDVVSRETGFRPTDVSCPSGVEAAVGGIFDCRFTGPEGEPYVARMRIIDVDGERVEFHVNSRPSAK